MPNQTIFERLRGIQMQLNGLHAGGLSMSSAAKGAEREDFINKYLAEMMPPPFRFGSGDVTDQRGEKSGQIDIVVEYPFLPSLPMVSGSSRLYLAEGVAAVVEVKSSVLDQWEQVRSMAAAVKKLERHFGSTLSMGQPQVRIPVFVVGYQGWRDIDTMKSKLENKDVDGILVIDQGLFASNDDFQGITASGPWALWGLIHCINLAASTLKLASASLLDYAK
ncbi:hypothetical protein HYV74_04905 [Candidatus Uhrbacteria bacterium]|nr:hypothetical protein [Candidatus Uhrbacteria bacterium]